MLNDCGKPLFGTLSAQIYGYQGCVLLTVIVPKLVQWYHCCSWGSVRPLSRIWSWHNERLQQHLSPAHIIPFIKDRIHLVRITRASIKRFQNSIQMEHHWPFGRMAEMNSPSWFMATLLMSVLKGGDGKCLGRGGISNSLAIEFDRWMIINTQNSNHVFQDHILIHSSEPLLSNSSSKSTSIGILDTVQYCRSLCWFLGRWMMQINFSFNLIRSSKQHCFHFDFFSGNC